jgi:hypothetical protein
MSAFVAPKRGEAFFCFDHPKAVVSKLFSSEENNLTQRIECI